MFYKNMKYPIWFKAKKYGWGWQPATWQAWVILIIYLVAIIILFKTNEKHLLNGIDTLLYYTLPFILLTALLVFISYKFGEKPGWRWGNKK